MEDRIVPSTVMWVGGSGDWSNSANWLDTSNQTHHVPTATDDAVIDVAGITVTHSTGTDTVHRLTSEDAVVLSDGSLSLAAASTIDNSFTLSGGTLSGLGTLTVNGLLTWTSGIMTGTAHTVAQGGLALNPSGVTQLDGRILDNTGTATWTGTGTLLTSNGGSIDNLAGAVFDVKGDGALSGFNAQPAFNNAGTFRKLDSSGTTTFTNIPFNNSGTVDVQTGTLSFGGGGDSTGSFVVEDGATLVFDGAQTLRAGSTVGGDGTVQFQGSFVGRSIVVLGHYSIPTTNIVTAVVDFGADAVLPNLNLNGTLTGLANVTVTGVLNWTGGTMSGAGTTLVTGALNIAGGTLDARTLNNAGTAVWLGGGLAPVNGGVFNNQPGATFDDRTDAAFGSTLAAPGTFNNLGFFTKSQSTGQTTVIAAFNNHGIVEVRTGTLEIAGTGTDTGAYTADAGAVLQFDSFSRNLTAPSLVTGTGVVQFTAGTTNVLGSFTPSGTVLVTAGTVNFRTDVDLTALTFSGGPGGVGTITGQGNVVVEGLLLWTGGTMSGTGSTTSNGTLTLGPASGSTPTLDVRPLINNGPATMTGTSIAINNGAVFENAAGATFLVRTNANINASGGGLFSNDGDFRKTDSSGKTNVGLFNNTGSVEVETGTLTLLGGGSSSGPMSVAAGTTLQFVGSVTRTTYTLSRSSSVDGDGTVLVGDVNLGRFVTVNILGSYSIANTSIRDGGIANFAIDATINALTLDSSFTPPASLTGTGNLTVTGALSWSGGAMAGAGSTTAAGTLNISGAANKDLNGRTLVNAGTASWTGTGTLTIRNGAVLDNQTGAVLVIQNDTTLSGGGFMDIAGTFTNEGTLRKQASSGTTTIATPFTTSGSVDVRTGTLAFAISAPYTQTAGNTVLATGTTLAAFRVDILAGSLAGTGTISGNLFNSGMVSPGGDGTAGILTINGTFTQTDAGTLRIDLGGTDASTQYDQLRVTDNVILGGSLVVNLIGGFSPADGQTFQILTFASKTRDFNTRSFPDLGPLFLDPIYSPTDLTLVTREGTASEPTQSTVIWVGDSGDWGNAANWLDTTTGVHRIPTAADDAIINVDGITVTHSTGTDTVHSVVSEAPFILSGGALILMGPSSTIDNTFTLSGANTVLSGRSTLTVNGLLTWTGGIMLGFGRTVAAGGLALSGSSGTRLDTRELDNAATATWSGTGNVVVFNGAVINNLRDAAFDVMTSAGFTLGGGALPVFNNAGSFRKVSSSDTTTFGIAFNNSGSVDVQTGTLALGSGGDSTGSFVVESGATLALGGGTHVLRAAATVSGGGTVQFGTTGSAGAGTVTVLGNYSVPTTNLVSSVVNFATDTVMPNLNLSGTLTGLANVTITNVLNWTGGTMSGAGTTLVTGALNITGASPKTLDSRTLNNAGAAIWLGGDLQAIDGAVINNQAGATFDDQVSASLGVAFNNQGLFAKTQSTGQTVVNAIFQNAGTVAIHAGALLLSGGSIHSGTLTADAGTTLRFDDGTHTLTATSIVAGPGNVVFGGNPFFNGPAINILGTFAPGGTVTVNRGIVNFGTNVDLATLSITGGTVTGDGNITVEGVLVWTGGTITGSGNTTSRGSLTLNSSGNPTPTLDGRTLTNDGTATWSPGGGQIVFRHGAVFNNAAGATFLVPQSIGILDTLGGCVFNNDGDFRIGTFATAIVNLVFNNAGSVEVENGALDLGGGGDITGPISIAVGSALQLSSTSSGPSATTYTLRNTSAISGNGTVLIGMSSSGENTFVHVLGSYVVGSTVINSGTADCAADETVRRLGVQGGTLTGAANLTVTDVMSWSGRSAMTGVGSTIAAGSFNSIAGGPFAPDLNGRTLAITGTATWNGGSLTVRNGGVLDIQPSATFTIQGNTDLSSAFDVPGIFTNEGVLQRQGSGTTTVSVPFTNSGTVDLVSGTLSFSSTYTQTDGNTTLATATTLAASRGLNLQGGSLSGSGTVSGSVINAGLVSPGGDGTAGILTITGNYTQTENGELLIDLGGTAVGTQYDQVHVNGSVTLDGSLVVELTNDFSPTEGQSFQILTFSSRTGDFATTSFPDLGTLFLDPVYNSTSLTLVTRTR
jgi:hypothetical protein